MHRFLAISLCTALTAAVHAQNTGLNIVLNQPPSAEVLAALGKFGTVLDVMPEIRCVTLRGTVAALQAIQALPCVNAAAEDVKCFPAAAAMPRGGDLSGGASTWGLDAINVTDFDAGRTVPFTGAGVYVAVLDTGLLHQWEQYFPAEQIAVQFARAIGGGGGERGSISAQPNLWGFDNSGHGTHCTAVILGFRYLVDPPALPSEFNGVAPGATIIPVKIANNNIQTWSWSSVMARGVLYVSELKNSGALGSSPVVINISWGGHDEQPVVRAAIDYAIASGIVVVAAGGNEADQGMRFPAAYPEVISAAATGWTGAFPADDLTEFAWTLNDVPENDASIHFIAPFSSREQPGQQLDVAAPGAFVPVPQSQATGQVDYSYFVGTSAATPHVVGVAALMLEKNPSLNQAQVESILKTTAMPLAPANRSFRFGVLLHGGSGGQTPTLGNGWANSTIIDLSTSWGPDATGAGLIQADAALSATP
jgi:subtilisin family serine protease